MQNHSQSLILAGLAILAWSFIPVVARFGQDGMDSYQFLFWSNLLSSVVIVICVIAFGKWPRGIMYTARDIAHASLLGFLGCCFYYLCLYYGYAHGNGLEVLVFQYTWPLLIVLLSLWLLKEKLTLQKAAAVLLGFAGVMVVITRGRLEALPLEAIGVDLIVLIGAFSFALFSVLAKRFKRDPVSSVLFYFLSATVASAVVMLVFSTPALPPQSTLLSVIVNGALINGVSYLLWIKALSLSEASRIAPLVFFTPVLSAVLIVLVFGEPFLAVYVVGLVLVIGAGLLTR